MVSFTASAVATLALAASCQAESLRQRERRLSFEYIAGYEPASLVTDHNAIDLDQVAIEVELATGTIESFDTAKSIYTNGGYSKSYASVTLLSPLLGPLSSGTQVLGLNADGNQVAGTVLDNYPASTTNIGIQYSTTQIQAAYAGCLVGSNPLPVTTGCFAESGTLTIDGVGPLEYAYDALTNNLNGRTIRGFSTDAKEKMYQCTNCPYSTYEKFYDYYGEFDYADKWVMAAFDGVSTDFDNGNADFTLYGVDGRRQAIQKGTAYMNVWMYVIREMEDAIDDCDDNCSGETQCNDDPVHAWDEAVAFYTGSLEGTDGESDGVLLYDLADKRCANFNTCGDLADTNEGTAHVNLEIFREFNNGKNNLLTGKCADLRKNKERIEALMAVPLIQGTLRYAHITDSQGPGNEAADAEGAVFAASVLPIVHACDGSAAETIYKNMQTGQDGSANFSQVKKAFEKVYDCMEIRCKDVGGVYDWANKKYVGGGKPCGSGGRDINTGLAVGLSIGGIALVALIVCGVTRGCGMCSGNAKSFDTAEGTST